MTNSLRKVLTFVAFFQKNIDKAQFSYEFNEFNEFTNFTNRGLHVIIRKIRKFLKFVA